MHSKIFLLSILIAVATLTSNIILIELASAQNNTQQTSSGEDFFNGDIAPPTSMNPDLTLDNINSDLNLSGNYYHNFTHDNRTTDWALISGVWEFTNQGLHGGVLNDTTDPINNIVLSPFTTPDLANISTSFRIDQIQNDTINYATIIYSFVDFNNFKSAGLFINNSDVFVRFTNITNGVASFNPEFELLKTDLHYKPGSFFEMTLSLNGESQDLIVNGTKYLSQYKNLSEQPGYTGLSYSRIGSVDFADFGIETEIPSNVVVRDSNSILLQGYEIPTGDYIHVYDSTPYKIESGHIAVKLPCNNEDVSDIHVYAGQAPKFQPLDLILVSELSTSDGLCLYHADLQSSSENYITDIAIQNESPEDLEFPDTSSIVLDISRISKIP